MTLSVWAGYVPLSRTASRDDDRGQCVAAPYNRENSTLHFKACSHRDRSSDALLASSPFFPFPFTFLYYSSVYNITSGRYLAVFIVTHIMHFFGYILFLNAMQCDESEKDVFDCFIQNGNMISMSDCSSNPRH